MCLEGCQSLILLSVYYHFLMAWSLLLAKGSVSYLFPLFPRQPKPGFSSSDHSRAAQNWWEGHCSTAEVFKVSNRSTVPLPRNAFTSTAAEIKPPRARQTDSPADQRVAQTGICLPLLMIQCPHPWFFHFLLVSLHFYFETLDKPSCFLGISSFTSL